MRDDAATNHSRLSSKLKFILAAECFSIALAIAASIFCLTPSREIEDAFSASLWLRMVIEIPATLASEILSLKLDFTAAAVFLFAVNLGISVAFGYPLGLICFRIVRRQKDELGRLKPAYSPTLTWKTYARFLFGRDRLRTALRTFWTMYGVYLLLLVGSNWISFLRILTMLTWIPLYFLLGEDWDRQWGYWGARALEIFGPIPYLLIVAWIFALIRETEGSF